MLPLHNIHLSNIHRLLIAEKRNNYSKPDGSFGGGDGHNKKYENLPRLIAKKLRESNEREVDGVEHQLDAHKNNDSIPAKKNAGSADHEEDRRYREIMT